MKTLASAAQPQKALDDVTPLQVGKRIVVSVRLDGDAVVAKWATGGGPKPISIDSIDRELRKLRAADRGR